MIKFLREQDAGTLREIPIGSEVVYAKQVPPEYQESPFDEELFKNGNYWDGVCIIGDRDWQGFTNDDFDKITEVFDNGYLEDEEFEEDINYYLPPKHKEKYDVEEIATWQRIYDEWYDKPKQYAEALTLMTGNTWDYGALRGSVQREHVSVVYDTTKISQKDLEFLEMDYFNTGTEFEVEYGDGETVFVYCYSWDEEGMKQEIVDAVGGSPEDVILDTYY